MRLFSRSSTSGCAVSSPMATSRVCGRRSRNSKHRGPDERGMALNNRPVEMSDEFRNCRVIFARNCLKVEKAAAVVELHLSSRRQPFQCVGNLARNGARCDGFCQSVLPQIAHHAPPRALAVGQEDGCDRDNLTRRRAFLFHEKCVRLRGVEFRSAAVSGRESIPFVPLARRDNAGPRIILTDRATGIACDIQPLEREGCDASLLPGSRRAEIGASDRQAFSFLSQQQLRARQSRP